MELENLSLWQRLNSFWELWRKFLLDSFCRNTWQKIKEVLFHYPLIFFINWHYGPKRLQHPKKLKINYKVVSGVSKMILNNIPSQKLFHEHFKRTSSKCPNTSLNYKSYNFQKNSKNEVFELFIDRPFLKVLQKVLTF